MMTIFDILEEIMVSPLTSWTFLVAGIVLLGCSVTILIRHRRWRTPMSVGANNWGYVAVKLGVVAIVMAIAGFMHGGS